MKLNVTPKRLGIPIFTETTVLCLLMLTHFVQKNDTEIV